MPCYHPVTAYRLGCGSISFSERGDIADSLTLPCGRCIGCRLMRAADWATRASHEAQLHEFNCFVTLTYSDENLPPYGSLDHRHFQLFMKRLRKRFSDVRIRYLMCGEYGEMLSRPHYHACLFGIDFADRKPFKLSSSGEQIYESDTLTSLWGLGHASVGSFTNRTASYTARYSLKKVLGADADSFYSVVDSSSGEVHFLTKPYLKASSHPGLGADWFVRFGGDVYPSDEVILNGTKFRPPKYYDKLLRRKSVLDLDDMKTMRELNGYGSRHDRTESRLSVREKVVQARVSLLKRSFSGE